MMGRAVEDAALDVRGQLLHIAAGLLDVPPTEIALDEGQGPPGVRACRIRISSRRASA